MKRTIKIIITICIIITFITGCQSTKKENLSENIKKIQLTGNLVTYRAYYHNVIEHDKKAGKGISHVFEKDRKIFAEYTGTIKLGIDLTKVKIETNGNEINVYIPKAKIIGEPNVDKDDFKEENFIESKDGINKNKITADDMAEAFDDAQKNIKKSAEKDEELLSLAQTRAKVLIEEQIIEFSDLNEKDYIINWEYEQ